MPYDPEQHHRRSIRLKGYDDSQAGAYFVTICPQDRACLFGEVVDGEMRLNEYGKIVEQCWSAISDHLPNAELDAFVVMPNHLDGIVILVNPVDVGATHASPLPPSDDASRPQGPHCQSIPGIIGSFKSATTKRINQLRGTQGASV